MPSWSGSTPIVWGNRIFLKQSSGGTQSRALVCRGKPRFGAVEATFVGRKRENAQADMSSPSPVTDGTNVWAMTGTGILKAFDYEGKELWSRDIQKEYGQFGLYWGYASSPLLHEDSLYIQALHANEDRRPLVCSADRQNLRKNGLARRAPDEKQSMNPRTPILRPLSSATARLLNSSSAGATLLPDTTLQPGRNSGERADSTRPTTLRIG